VLGDIDLPNDFTSMGNASILPDSGYGKLGRTNSSASDIGDRDSFFSY